MVYHCNLCLISVIMRTLSVIQGSQRDVQVDNQWFSNKLVVNTSKIGVYRAGLKQKLWIMRNIYIRKGGA